MNSGRIARILLLIAGLGPLGCESGFMYSTVSWMDGVATVTEINDDGVMTLQASWTRDGIQRELLAQGVVEWSDDDRDLVLRSADARVVLEEQGGAAKHELTLHRVDGVPEYAYVLQGSTHDFDPAARAWLEEFLADALVRIPLGANPRARRIIDQQGPAGLLQEVQRFESSSLVAIYLKQLLEQAALDEAQLEDVVHTAEHKVTSNSSLGEILQSVAGQLPDSDPLSHALIRATHQVTSNSWKQELLTSIEQRRNLTREAETEWFEAALEITSNSTKQELIEEFLDRRSLDEETFAAVMRITASITSNSTQQELLERLMRASPLPASSWPSLIETIDQLTSSSSRRDLVIEAIHRGPRDPATRSLILEVIQNIPSRSSQHEAYHELLLQTDLAPATLEELAEAVQQLSSRSARTELEDEIRRKRGG